MESDGERQEKCGVLIVVCNERQVDPVNFSWKWGEDELPIVDQYTYLGVEISKEDCSWDTHIKKTIGKGKSHVGKTDVIVLITDSHLGTTIKRCILMQDECDSTKARICRRSMGREREVRKRVGNSSTNDSS